MLSALILLAMMGADWSDAELSARIKASPPDVAAFASRRIGCNYWEGESDPAVNIPERESQIQQALKPLRCESLKRDERRLRRKYRQNGELIRLLREVLDFLP
jgi:hypothetical protein